ncbi:hypothetical protein QYE76_005266 [Lolium multiflorum]|uniref:Myb/SANT-like domain-containing protein n=1 Tax=Lolium multiflorum TaxID=4521 RepID=A0AAD8RSA5_LOLMU|nr:hypothetical protein QYE76_005266 [Lolium multiflorum]
MGAMNLLTALEISPPYIEPALSLANPNPTFPPTSSSSTIPDLATWPAVPHRTVGEAYGSDGGCGGGYWPRRMVVFFVYIDDFSCGTVVLPASSTGTVVLAASSPGSPASPTSVLRVAPLTLVPSGVYFNMGFKEQQMKKVAADVLAFTGVHVTTLQLYNHIRNWRTKWSVIMKMKSDRILDWSEDGCCFYGGDEGAADEYITRYPKHRQYVGTPITNYAQMKMIFTPRFVCKAQLFQPNLLVRALDFIADNEAEYAVYPIDAVAALVTALDIDETDPMAGSKRTAYAGSDKKAKVQKKLLTT